MEQWKDIPGYEGYYQISSFGQVKNIQTNKLLKGDINNAGYKRVVLYTPTKHRYFIHQLVAKIFCEGWQNGLVVNHIDGNKQNNNKNNLEWVTRSHNDLHAFALKLREPQGAALIQQKKSKRKVYMYEYNTNDLIKIYNSADAIAQEYHLNKEYIQQCCRGLYKFKNKYRLSYIELT